MILKGDVGFAIAVCGRLYGDYDMCLRADGHMGGHVYTRLKMHRYDPPKITPARQRAGVTQRFFAMMNDGQLSANVTAYRMLLRDFPDSEDAEGWADSLERAATELERRC